MRQSYKKYLIFRKYWKKFHQKKEKKLNIRKGTNPSEEKRFFVRQGKNQKGQNKNVNEGKRGKTIKALWFL